jgi:hypothetical protein
VNVSRIDLGGKVMPAAAKIWERHGNPAQLPWVVAVYPEEDEKAPPAWAGPLDEAGLRQLIDSPARQRLVKLLTGGESVVWVLLESGNQKADDAAMALLERELPRLQKAIQLPEQKDDDESRLLSKLPLRLSFQAVRLSRKAPGEAAFVRMLLESEDGLPQAKGPIVFPIFGRGRALLGMHGEHLTAARLDYWASFLSGPCSCKVKELNPGIDMLISADWEELLETTEPQGEPAPPTPAAPAIPPGAAETPAPAGQEPDTSDPGSRWWLWTGLGAGALLLALTGARLLRLRGAR